ncbi:hypothetical protein CSOJ01_14390 [Colletotrichum sojae]|uniref:Uncharacterized protein n=1 Tax=Colletotrichum sojae TaxID=2175907 RepID=A0A8H6IQG1_9PEZI|nr:hypothetical protein CSOJ01_14390 [Colletotrichum sojae]
MRSDVLTIVFASTFFRCLPTGPGACLASTAACLSMHGRTRIAAGRSPAAWIDPLADPWAADAIGPGRRAAAGSCSATGVTGLPHKTILKPSTSVPDGGDQLARQQADRSS